VSWEQTNGHWLEHSIWSEAVLPLIKTMHEHINFCVFAVLSKFTYPILIISPAFTKPTTIKCETLTTSLRGFWGRLLLSADFAGKLNVLGHDGATLGVDGTQVYILEEINKVCLGCLLKSTEDRSLPKCIRLEFLSDLTNQTGEGELAKQQIGVFLIMTDLAKGDGARTVAAGLPRASCGGRVFASILGGPRLAWLLSSSAPASGLPCTGHYFLDGDG
jgi:hypothetical protein